MEGLVESPPRSAELEEHRRELLGYCYRMLGSPFEAEDAVQDTLLKAWRAQDSFEGRSSLRSWLYRIATNVCLDMRRGERRRARPMDLGPAGDPDPALLTTLAGERWIEPIPDDVLDPADRAVRSESVRLAFVAALQHLSARQRAAVILCEVLQWRASEAAELLETTTAAINSALQRARATLAQVDADAVSGGLDAAGRDLLARYVDAFESYDVTKLTALIREDAIMSMPPYELWLRGREHVLAWFYGPGIGCKDSKLIATSANGQPAFGQYKRSPDGGHEPWSITVLDVREGGVAELTFFLATETLFPLFGLPPRLPA